MSVVAPETWVDRAGDRLNPIVVKEIRQGLRTRIFWISFGAMLLACVVISLVAFATYRDDQFAEDGAEFFFAYFAALSAVQFFIIPYSAYRSLAKEREEETWVLLCLTGVGPRRILRGKLGSLLLQAALYASAATPFMLFSYFLNGIDLPTLLITVALAWAYSVFLTVVALAAATLAEAKLFRSIVHLGLLATLAGASFLGLVLAQVWTEHGLSRQLNEPIAWALLAGGLWGLLTFGALIFEGAAAKLSALTDPYARGPRLVFLGQLLLGATLAVGVWNEEKRSEVAAVLGILFCLVVVSAGAFLVCDVDGQSRRHRAATRFFSLLQPGALRGFRLVMAALGLGVALFVTLYFHSTKMYENLEPLAALLSGAAYVALYLSLTVMAGRLPFLRPLGVAAASRLMFVVLVFLGSTVPPLLSVLAGKGTDDRPLNLFNPIIGFINFTQSTRDGALSGLWLLGAVALSAVLVSERLLAALDRRTP